jgi:glutamyl-Q tRNA(Asp) synthetase
LHLGSLICALASYLDARHHGGLWLMRMEDLDPPREPAGAAESILDSLRSHGLEWDGEVLWQGQRHAAYADTVNQLLERSLAFRCDCSRAMVQAAGNVYDGRCRNRQLPPDTDSAIRVRVDGDTCIAITDQLQAALKCDVAAEVGDFIIQRRDGLYAYQLAVVLDDAFQGINQVLRGHDLYDSTPRQVYLQKLLGLPTPTYTHIPVITNAQGQKLSKQTHAPALRNEDAQANLRLALEFLGQGQPPPDCQRPDGLLQHAADNWRLDAVPASEGIPEATLY